MINWIKAPLSQIIRKSPFNSRPVTTTLIWRRKTLLRCNWQVNGVPWFKANQRGYSLRQNSPTFLWYRHGPVVEEWLTATLFRVFFSPELPVSSRLKTSGEATVSVRTQSTAEGPLAFPTVYISISFGTGLCAQEGNLLTCSNPDAADGSNGPPYSEWWGRRMLSWGALSVASH